MIRYFWFLPFVIYLILASAFIHIRSMGFSMYFSTKYEATKVITNEISAILYRVLGLSI